MKYKKTILILGLAALATLYGIYKNSPIISKSLENEGFRLVSNAKNKEDIYKRILNRYADDINRDIKLDDYLSQKGNKWVALSFWCDKETSNRKFFVSVDKYKKYCVMSVADYLKDGYLKGKGDIPEEEMYVSYVYFDNKHRVYEGLFKDRGLEWKGDDFLENYKKWIHWCKTRPFKAKDSLINNKVRYFCFQYQGMGGFNFVRI